jgi:hypothetical protein
LTVTIGLKSHESGWSILLSTYTIRIGTSECGIWFHSNGAIYEGQWHLDRFHGKGSLTYLDEIKYQGQWVMDQPLFNARHPMIRECLEKKQCINTLGPAGYDLPQYIYQGSVMFTCEHCYNYCFGSRIQKPQWAMFGGKCECPGCNS